mgnify:CR=1 FL=1
MKTPYRALVALALSCIVEAASATDDRHPPHPLTPLPGLTLAEVVIAAAAVTGAPEQTEAAFAEADAFQRRADLAFAQAPSLFLRQNRDLPGERTGLLENEVLLQFPLKRYGQSKIQASLAGAARELARSRGRERLWRLSGIVRELVWEHRERRIALEAAQLALAWAREVAQSVALRHRHGDLATVDTLAARSEILARERDLADARARLADAERAYTAWTGLGHVPADPSEAPAPETRAGHPALLAAADAVRRAESSVELQRASARTAPTLSIGPRRERGSSESARADSLTVMVNIPFGTEAYADPQVASARRSVTDAEIAYRRTSRELEMALHEAEHELRRAKALSDNRSDAFLVADERARIARVALDHGEFDVAEFLRIKNAADRARLARDLAELQIARAVARLNQARGHLPTGVVAEAQP